VLRVQTIMQAPRLRGADLMVDATGVGRIPEGLGAAHRAVLR